MIYVSLDELLLGKEALESLDPIEQPFYVAAYHIISIGSQETVEYVQISCRVCGCHSEYSLLEHLDSCPVPQVRILDRESSPLAKIVTRKDLLAEED
jgi:hypothetical protein